MISRLQALWSVAVRAVKAFGRDGCMQKAAALSFYALFSLPGLLYAASWLAARVVDAERVQARIEREVGGVMGDAGVSQVRTMMERAARDADGFWGQALGVCLLLFSATSVMVQVQTALNRVWDVRPSVRRSGFVRMLIKRAVSLAMVIFLAAFIVTSLGIEVVVSQGASALFLALFGQTPPGTIHTLSTVFNLALLFAAFTSAYRFLPDKDVRLRDAAVGGLVAAGMFVAAKRALAAYFAVASVGSPFGAAGSLAILLVWVDCSAIVFLLGAEVTRSWGEETLATAARSSSKSRPVSQESGGGRTRRE